MLIRALKTFARSTDRGMIVGNMNDEMTIPDDMVETLVASGHVEVIGQAAAPVAAPVAAVGGELPDVGDLSVARLKDLLPTLSLADVQAMLAAEETGKNRAGAIAALQESAALKADEAEAELDAAVSRVAGDEDEAPAS